MGESEGGWLVNEGAQSVCLQEDGSMFAPRFSGEQVC